MSPQSRGGFLAGLLAGFSVIIFAVSVVVLVRYWGVLGERGLVADETGTPGATSTGETVAIAAALSGLAVSVIGLVLSIAHLRRQRTKVSASAPVQT